MLSKYLCCIRDEHDERMYVMELLAEARYDELMKTDRKNFMRFAYELIKDRADDLQTYLEREEHIFLPLVECISLVILDEIYWQYNKSLKEFMCCSYVTDYGVSRNTPRIFAYDPNFDYTRDEYFTDKEVTSNIDTAPVPRYTYTCE